MASQIKSKKRVKEFAEVFTAEREVKAMCDLIPKEMYEDITKTFLEPCVGEGVFLIEILKRKFKHCKDDRDGLKALSSVVGIDIQLDNVEITRKNLEALFLDKFPTADSFVRAMAEKIIKNNIIHGDSLKIMQEWIDENNPIQPQQLSLFSRKD